MIDKTIALLFLLVFIFYALKVYFHYKYLKSVNKLTENFGEIILHPFRYNRIKFKLLFLFFFYENFSDAKAKVDRSNLLLAKSLFYAMWLTILLIATLILTFK